MSTAALRGSGQGHRRWPVSLRAHLHTDPGAPDPDSSWGPSLPARRQERRRKGASCAPQAMNPAEAGGTRRPRAAHGFAVVARVALLVTGAGGPCWAHLGPCACCCFVKYAVCQMLKRVPHCKNGHIRCGWILSAEMLTHHTLTSLLALEAFWGVVPVLCSSPEECRAFSWNVLKHLRVTLWT